MGTDFLPNVNLSQLNFCQATQQGHGPLDKENPQALSQNSLDNPTNQSHAENLGRQLRGNLSDLGDFDSLIPPDQIPQQTLQLKTLPNEILKSSTVENLISQNDDLMARLKVSLRRLAIIENENLKLKEECQKYSQRHENMADQILLSQERDRAWKQKIEHFEKQKDVAVEKTNKLTAQNRNFRAELDRYHKYHDRIKNQIKPYIAQLKDFARTLQEKNQNLERDLAKRETQTEQLRLQI
jgi:chromosome segregation ATPase